MSWVASILKLAPVLGNLAGTVIEKVWPDRSDARTKAHEVEMEEMRKFRLPPKTLLRYVIAGTFVWFVAWMTLASVFPGFPQPPFDLQAMLVLADTLFGLGGQ